MNADEIGQALRDFVAQPRSVLFAGAGVGCRVGLPNWGEWLHILADVCSEFGDPRLRRLYMHGCSREIF
ncbi:MAG TPA: hypothetical protein DCG89_07880 [Spartobacteria bacterium]|nr:hypothetical protein [Spartobacteria bacterium]